MIEKIKKRLDIYTSNENFKEILTGSLYSFGSKILVKVLGIITSIIAARYYGADIIGLMALLLSIMTISSLFADFGLSTALLRLIPEYTEKYSKKLGIELYKKVLKLSIFIALVTSSILYLLSTAIANNIFEIPELEYFIKLATIALLFTPLSAINSSMLRILKKIKLFASLGFISKLISTLMLIILTYYFYNKYNLIYVAILPTVFVSICLILYIRTLTRSSKNNDLQIEKLPSYKNILAISSPMLIISGMNVIMGQTDVVMLGILRNTNEVGIYSIVMALVSLTSFVLVSVNSMMAPNISELFHSGQKSELKNIVQRTSKLMFWATLPIIVFLILFGEYLLAIFGNEFKIGFIALCILTLGQFINAMTGSVGNVLNMLGYQKLLQNIVISSAVINIVLNYLLIPRYGIEGAAIASFISMTYLNIVSVLYVRKKVGFYTFYFPGVKI